jgi:hypothetical protein
MSVLIRIIAFLGTVISFSSAIFVFVSNLKTKKMQVINSELNQYVKKKEYLFMKNGGDNPCETTKKFGMPLFSQESDYIIRRKKL